MNKLTLSARPEIIKKAKRLANKRGSSVSELFSQFIQSFEEKDDSLDFLKNSPKTRKAVGLVKWPKGKSEKELIEEALLERYCNEKQAPR